MLFVELNCAIIFLFKGVFMAKKVAIFIITIVVLNTFLLIYLQFKDVFKKNQKPVVNNYGSNIPNQPQMPDGAMPEDMLTEDQIKQKIEQEMAKIRQNAQQQHGAYPQKH